MDAAEAPTGLVGYALVARRLHSGVVRVASGLRATRLRSAALLCIPLLAVVMTVLPPAWLVHRVYFDRSRLPALDAFIRFDPPTTGVVRDARGKVLIELAHEYRRVVTYEEVPPILRQAILAASNLRGRRWRSQSGEHLGQRRRSSAAGSSFRSRMPMAHTGSSLSHST
jgi:hypothetical protein